MKPTAITDKYLESLISSIDYKQDRYADGRVHTFAVVKLKDGGSLIGFGSIIPKEIYTEELGVEKAYRSAMDKLRKHEEEKYVLKKLTPDELKDLIAEDRYLYDGTLTICILELKNGFKVIGHSACLADKDYDRKLGEKIAYDSAFDKLWEYAGLMALNDVYTANIKQ